MTRLESCCAKSAKQVPTMQRLSTPALVTEPYTRRLRHSSETCTSIFIWRTTFSFRERWRWKARLVPSKLCLKEWRPLMELESLPNSIKQDSTESLLEEDHASLGGLIEELCAALDGSDVARSFALLDLVWARLAVHIRAEHLCLFP